MANTSVDELMAVETRLNRSLAACVVVILALVGWAFVMLKMTTGAGAGLVGLGLFVLQLACYVWYAIAAGAAARALGEAGWKYVAWILAAPFLALAAVPLSSPLVAMVIAVSPLSIKFLLGGQLQRAIHERTFAD